MSLPADPGKDRNRVWAWVRARGPGVVTEFAINFALPYLIYVQSERALGQVLALIASSAPPMLWGLVTLVRKRRLDALSILALTTIVLSLLAFLGGGGAKFLQVRERLVTAAIGLLFLGSAAIGKPLIHQLARARVRTRPAHEANAFDALRETPIFRRTMMVLTLVWGTVLLADAAIAGWLVFALSIRLYMIVNQILGLGSLGITTAWSYWYAHRRLRPVAISFDGNLPFPQP